MAKVIDITISIHRSLAGPDWCRHLRTSLARHFNPQVPCGTRRAQNCVDWRGQHISIHRSLAGPDCRHSVKKSGRLGFQSTGPLRDPTAQNCVDWRGRHISIHRSLAGPDEAFDDYVQMRKKFQSTGPLRDPTSVRDESKRKIIYFNPQVPCGTRPVMGGFFMLKF